MRKRSPIPPLLVALVFAASAVILPASPALAAPGPCAPGETMEYVTPVTFHVAIARFKKSYSVGDPVKVNVTVTRPAEEDPAGLGVSLERPFAQPAAEVNVGVGISAGRVFLPGFGRTDAKGKTTVSIKLARYVKPGSAHVRAFAYKEVVNTTCLTVEEQGYRTLENAFKITR